MLKKTKHHGKFSFFMMFLLLLLQTQNSLAAAVTDQFCQSYRYQPVTAAESVDAPGFLLAVEQSGKPASFILASYHASVPEVRGYWDRVAVLLTLTDTYITERRYDRDGLGDDVRLLAEEDSLTDRLAGHPGLYLELIGRLQRYGLPIAEADRFKPWFAAALLEQAPVSGDSRTPILDQFLYRLAVDLRLDIVPLETLQQLADRYQRFSSQEQIDLIGQAVCNDDSSAGRIADLTAAFAADRPEQFYRLLGSWGSDRETLNEKLNTIFVTERNQHFQSQIAPLLAEGGVLIVLGNLHVYGEQGLYRWLQDDPRYSVRPLDPDRLQPEMPPEAFPDLTAWVSDWARMTGPDRPDIPLTDRPVITARTDNALQQLLCPGRRCQVESTYRSEHSAVHISVPIWVQLLSSRSTLCPELTDTRLTFRLCESRGAKADTDQTLYAESLLVRELVRYIQDRNDSGSATVTDRHCVANRHLHQAVRAQQAYLRARGSRHSIHWFPLDPRCQNN